MKIVINPAYGFLEGFIKTIPASFQMQGEVIYQERNTLKRIQSSGIFLCVKSFHIPFFFNQIAYGIFRSSKAERSYQYGLQILEKGINTPIPVAYIENKRCGLLYDSYYICLDQPHTGMMRELRQGPLKGREGLLSAFARFAAHIHSQGVLHKDFSPGNILYAKSGNEYSFYLVDINRMVFKDIDIKAGCKNLNRLWGSNEMIRFVAREYAAARGFDPEECEHLTLQYHAEFWKRYARRHHGFLPYIAT